MHMLILLLASSQEEFAYHMVFIGKVKKEDVQLEKQ